MIELRHLRYFVAVAEELHFGRAAERLHMAQSPLSHQVRRLEAELGVELLSRGHHVLGLTDAGRAFRPAAQSILDQLDEAVRSARRAGRGLEGTVRVGVAPEVGAAVVTTALRRFREAMPQLVIALRHDRAEPLYQALRHGEIEAAFIRSFEPRTEFELVALADESLVAALPDRRNGGRRRVALTTLASEEFVLPSARTAPDLRQATLAACEQAGFSPTVAAEADSLPALLLLVAAGVGVSLVPAGSGAPADGSGVVTAELDVDVSAPTAGLAWPRGRRSQVVSRLVEAAASAPAAGGAHRPRG